MQLYRNGRHLSTVIFSSLPFLHHDVKRKWLYDKLLEGMQRRLAYMRLFRRSRNSREFAFFKRHQIAFRSETTCYWIGDPTRRLLPEYWQYSEWRNESYDNRCDSLRQMIKGRSLWIEMDRPVLLSDKTTAVRAAWITYVGESLFVFPLSRSLTHGGGLAEQFFADIACLLLRPATRPTDDPDPELLTLPPANRCVADHGEGLTVTILPNGRRLIHVSLIKWLKSGNGVSRRSRHSYRYSINPFRRHLCYCSRCSSRVRSIEAMRLDPCPKCGFKPATIDEITVRIIDVKGHERGPRGNPPPEKRYVA